MGQLGWHIFEKTGLTSDEKLEVEGVWHFLLQKNRKPLASHVFGRFVYYIG